MLSRLTTVQRNAIFIGGFLLTLYLFTFRGQFESIDELNLYATTESIVQQFSLSVPQVSFASYHNEVGLHEPTFSLLAAPLYWIAHRIDALDNIYTVMLINPLLVAGSSILIYLSAQQLRYSETGSLLAAFSFGIGSLGWFYALTFYREPLVGFLWILSLYCLLRWRETQQSRLRLWGALILLIACSVKINVLFSTPWLLLIGLKTFSLSRKQIIALLISLAAVLFIFFPLLFGWRLGADNGWQALYKFLLTIDIPIFPQRIYGQLASPIKGLFLYMPVLFLSVGGLFIMWRQHLHTAAGIICTTAALIGTLSFYESWFGGQSWGARLLVPTLPILCLPIAALWDRLQSTMARAVTLLVFAISVLLQLSPVTNNWWKGYDPFALMSSQPEFDVGLSWRYIALSPPLIMLRTWSTTHLMPIWAKADYDGILFVQSGRGVLLASCVLIVAAVWVMVQRTRRNALVMIVPIVSAVALITAITLQSQVGFPGIAADTARQLAHAARPNPPEPYTLISSSNEFGNYFLLGKLKGNFVHHWISPHQVDGFEIITETGKGRWLTFVADYVHLQPDASIKSAENWLNRTYHRLDHQSINGFELIHYAQFPDDDWTTTPITIEYPFVSFQSIAVHQTTVTQNDMLGIQLELCKQADAPEPYSIFLHLLSDQAIIEGHDGAVQYGTVDLSQWEVGQCAIERRAIRISADAPTGVYNLILGITNSAGPIDTLDIQGNTVPFQTLRQITIEPQND